MITSQEPSPSPPHLQGPLPAMQPRNRNRPSYVQRWKVLRDRNKNLPKLDFAAKATGVTKKIQGMDQLGRSLTYDSMKLPSISTCSVVTGVSGKSVHSDGYRKPSDSWDKKSTFMVSLHFERWRYNSSHQDLASGSYPDLTSRSELPELINTSKEAQTEASVTADEKKTDTHAHRYENITYKKQLLMRRRTKFSENDVQKRKEKAILAQAEDHLKQTIEKELSFVKNKQALVKRQLRRKEHKTHADGIPKSPSSSTVVTDTVTCTPDDVTLSSPRTLSKSSPSHVESNLPSVTSELAITI
ncbi:uncharacterized protein LOC128227470 isoform X1 [Mya arenaria]|uniref:uncharacterized protein LOC128227470 isoform X1 n=1 Tax=Mya arenaria TaxID=6604 RepID=UPI0022E81753|nr:uncharacterized protein LOC128227470 isoform X1 [Mya arenaria]